MIQAERSVTAAQQRLTETQATLQQAQTGYADMQQTLTEQQQQKVALKTAKEECARAEGMARAAVAQAQEQLHALLTPLDSSNRLLAQRLQQLVSCADSALLNSLDVQRGHALQLQPVELAMTALQTAIAAGSAQRAQCAAQLQAARAQCTAAAQQLAAAKESTAATATQYRTCKHSVAELQQQMPEVTQRLAYLRGTMQAAQDTVLRRQSRAAKTDRAAQQLQQQSGGSAEDQQAALQVSVEHATRQLAIAKGALITAREAQLRANGGAADTKASVQVQYATAVRAHTQKADAVKRLQ
jgi:chromosome segregation ATPase